MADPKLVYIVRPKPLNPRKRMHVDLGESKAAAYSLLKTWQWKPLSHSKDQEGGNDRVNEDRFEVAEAGGGGTDRV